MHYPNIIQNGLNSYINFHVSIRISEENYDAFCLAYMFTYRDFEGGTLGLAWTGDLKNAGGVCEKNGVSENTYTTVGEESQSTPDKNRTAFLEAIRTPLFHPPRVCVHEKATWDGREATRWKRRKSLSPSSFLSVRFLMTQELLLLPLVLPKDSPNMETAN